MPNERPEKELSTYEIEIKIMADEGDVFEVKRRCNKVYEFALKKASDLLSTRNYVLDFYKKWPVQMSERIKRGLEGITQEIEIARSFAKAYSKKGDSRKILIEKAKKNIKFSQLKVYEKAISHCADVGIVWGVELFRNLIYDYALTNKRKIISNMKSPQNSRDNATLKLNLANLKLWIEDYSIHSKNYKILLEIAEQNQWKQRKS